MKNFLSRSFLAILFLTIIVSCKKEYSVNKPDSSKIIQSAKDSNFVSIDVATITAKQVANSRIIRDIITKKNVNDLNSSGKQILDTIAVPDITNPSFYILNYVGGGYVVIPSDKRVEPILAYSNDGSFPKTGKLPSGLVNWLSVNHKKMQMLRKNTLLKAPPNVAKLWAEMMAKNAISPTKQAVNTKVTPPPPCQDYSHTTTVGPLLQTMWAQGYPYNSLCPAGHYYNTLNTPSGCVATAMSQIMYYWKSPSRYNWSIMPLTSLYSGSTASNLAVAQLMLDAGTSVDMQYHDDGSYPSVYYSFPVSIGSTSCSDALKNTFGYSSSTESNYDYAKVVSNINAHEPVILDASTDNNTILFWSWGYDGHTWVCDGYEQTDFLYCASEGSPTIGGTYLMLHMNWGWNEVGSSDVDGFYYYNQWTVLNGTTENLQYNQTMSYNIHP